MSNPAVAAKSNKPLFYN